jgi:transposase InsO family protein
MYMPYSNNPGLPKARMDAVRLVRQGWSIRKAARHVGYHHTAVLRWLRRVPEDRRKRTIPTRSSRPHRHPKALREDVVQAILAERRKHSRCAVAVHGALLRDGVAVSLSSVKRTLLRYGLTKRRSPEKRWHRNFKRPSVAKPGDLVQVDTIHVQPRKGKRFYVYTAVDLHSRVAHAKVVPRISAGTSLRFLREAERRMPFPLRTVQTDNGPEFTAHFTERLGIPHRHSRVRQSNDNAHVERFNRTLEEECLDREVCDPEHYARAIRRYLPYYNGERLHLGLNLKTPLQMVPSY